MMASVLSLKFVAVSFGIPTRARETADSSTQLRSGRNDNLCQLLQTQETRGWESCKLEASLLLLRAGLRVVFWWMEGD